MDQEVSTIVNFDAPPDRMTAAWLIAVNAQIAAQRGSGSWRDAAHAWAYAADLSDKAPSTRAVFVRLAGQGWRAARAAGEVR